MKRKEFLSLRQMKVCRVNSGIILADQDLQHAYQRSSYIIDTGATVADLMQLPVSFWILDANSETQVINQEGVNVCGFRSEKDALGNSIIKVSERQSALQLIKNCDEVIDSGEFKIFDECHIRKDGIQQQFLSIKLPWYDADQRLAGVFGFSIVLGRHSLANNLSMLQRLGILTNTTITPVSSATQSLQRLSLAPRERQCLHFMMKGYTAKMIARELNLSFRTIESYINNLKARLGVNSRTELIQLAQGSR